MQHMDTEAPTRNELIDLSVALNARPWDDVRAGIPAWHPRNDGDGQGDGSAEETSTETQIPKVDLPFSYDDIGDDFQLTGAQAREWLAAREAQMNSGLQRKFQDLSAAQKAVEPYQDLVTALSSDDDATKDAAIIELAKRHGFDFEEGEEEEAAEAVANATADPALTARIDAIERTQQQREADEKAEQERTAWQQHVVASMQDVVTKLKGKDATIDDLPEAVRIDIVQRAIANPRAADGLPDFETALAQHLQLKEFFSGGGATPTGETTAAQDAAAYRQSKEAPTPGVTGTSGVTTVTRGSQADRMKRADAAASKHYAGT